MRFMIIVKAHADTESGAIAPAALLADMDVFHEALARTGVLLDSAKLKASAHGWRVAIGGDGRQRVRDGPFAETQQLIAGYTLIQARSREEAVEWWRRFPIPTLRGTACEIEVLPLFEAEEFALGEH